MASGYLTTDSRDLENSGILDPEVGSKISLPVFHRHEDNPGKRRTDAEDRDARHHEPLPGIFRVNAEVNEGTDAKRGDVRQDECEPEA